MDYINKIILIACLLLCNGLKADIFVKGTETHLYNDDCSNSSYNFQLPPVSFVRLSSSVTANELQEQYLKCPINIEFSEEITIDSIGFLSTILRNLADAPMVIINLNSDGGSVEWAMNFGKELRQYNYDNVVITVSEKSRCLSSCTLMLASGYQKAVFGKVGIHRPYFEDGQAHEMGYTSLKEFYDAFYIKLGKYFGELNISEGLLSDMWGTPSHEIKILSVEELDEYGLSRDDAVWTEIKNSKQRALGKIVLNGKDKR